MKPTCQQLIDFLDDYVAGDLSPEHAEGFAWHLDRCPSCVAYVASYRETVRAARHASPAPLAPLPPALIAAILTTIAPRK